LGYSGKNQFWFGIQEPGAFDLGMEINGEVSGAVAGAFRTPIGAWEAYNVTLIGSGANPGKLGLRIREAAAPSIAAAGCASISSTTSGPTRWRPRSERSSTKNDRRSAGRVPGGLTCPRPERCARR